MTLKKNIGKLDSRHRRSRRSTNRRMGAAERRTTMSEFRQNFVTKEWVIIAPERRGRPNDFTRHDDVPEPRQAHRDDCPFCPGNEAQTGREFQRVDAGDGWLIRSVENKYSA